MPARLKHWLREDKAQDAFEYLLATGAIAVVAAAGFFVLREVVPAAVEQSCSSVNTAAADPDDCINETP